MSEQVTNAAIAAALEQLADRLEDRQENPHRVQAYRRAAQSVRQAERPLVEMLEAGGPEALQELPGIGDSIASRIAGFVQTGRLALLEALQQSFTPERVFGRLPGIGAKLARQIHEQLGIETLEELEVAAHDGRLQQVEGFGPGRIQAVRAQVGALLSRTARNRVRRYQRQAQRRSAPEPPIRLLLSVDREYRERSAAGSLRRIAPRRFNPTGEAWLPILRTQRSGWLFTALFSNTARAHALDRTDDWVVIRVERNGQEQQYTVVTETKGPVKDMRVVRGREADCRDFYKQRSARAA